MTPLHSRRLTVQPEEGSVEAVHAPICCQLLYCLGKCEVQLCSRACVATSSRCMLLSARPLETLLRPSGNIRTSTVLVLASPDIAASFANSVKLRRPSTTLSFYPLPVPSPSTPPPPSDTDPHRPPPPTSAVVRQRVPL